jgi:hypothetical protein
MGNEIPGAENLLGDPTGAAPPVGVDQLAEVLLGGTGDNEPDPEELHKEEEKVRLIFKRISASKIQKKKWEDNYEVDRSHDYVRGFQRDESDELDAQGDRKYQINKILAALKTRIPSLFYYFPYVRVKPSYGRADSADSQVHERAQLLQDTANTIVRQPRTRFKPETMLALKEAHWAFGVTEVGYEAEWGENPFQAAPGPLVENEDVRRTLEAIEELPEEDSVEEAMQKLDEVPHMETFYVKHIPAKQFYVASNDRSATERQDWVGYWEWMYVEDIKRTDTFEGTEELKASAKHATEGSTVDQELIPTIKDENSKEIPPDMVKVWKIWDMREKIRYVVAEGHDRILKATGFYFLPLAFLRFEVMPGEWYPIPPIFNQLTEQDEVNDSREWLRIVRKGTRPRYIYDKSAFSADELEKLETDDFFTMIGVDNQNLQPIVPVEMPQVAEAVIRTLSLADSGFSEQSASSPVDRMTRGAGGKPTATEVEAMGSKGSVRDSYEQQEVADWLGSIATSIIKCALEKMTLPQWVIINSDPTGPAFGIETQIINQSFSQYMQLLHENMKAFGVQTDEQAKTATATPSVQPQPQQMGQGGPPQGGMPPQPGMEGQPPQGGAPPPQGGAPPPQGGAPPPQGGAPPPQGMGGPPQMPGMQGAEGQAPPEPSIGGMTDTSPMSEQGMYLGTPISPPTQIPGMPGKMAQQYQQVTPEQLQQADDGMQWDLTVDVESLSPVTEEQHGNRLIQALNMVASPGVGQLLAMSPPLLKTVLNLMGIRNSNDQKNIFGALQIKMQNEQQMAMMGGPGPVGVAPSGGAGSPEPGAGSSQGPQPGGPQPASKG